jgi:hypothetical protein
MRYPAASMRRPAISLLALLAGCSQSVANETGGDPTVTTAGPDMGEHSGFIDGPRIERLTADLTPGGTMFVQTDVPIADVELRLAGALLPAPPIVTGGGVNGLGGGLFALPADLAPGQTELRVRSRGAAADSDAAPVTVAAPLFADVAEQTGLLHTHDIAGHPTDCAWSSTGLAFGDLDNDGDSDFYVGNIGSAGRLLRNDGDADGDGLPDFVEVTAALGLGAVDNVSMASFMDYDNDGDRDLFIGRRGANVLMQNRLVETGAPGFLDVTGAVGLGADEQRTMGVAWGDYDGDGDLDLYVVNHALCFPRKGSELRPQDHLYRNDAGVFTEVSDQLDLGPGSPLLALGFSAVWLDIERDGDPDLIVINDHIAELSGPNALWRNDGPGDQPGAWRFTSVAAAAGLAIPADADGEGVNGMGLAIGDVDHDGLPDLAFSNIGPNYLLLNRGNGTFIDASPDAAIRRGVLPWGKRSITWAVHLFDLDNDSDLDLYFAGGPIHDDSRIPDALLRNDGAPAGEVPRFTEITWAAGLDDLGSGKGSALVDLDRDGALEFATARWADRLRVYHNQRPGPANHWLDVDLVGTSSNREALGSVVAIETPTGPRQTCFRTPNPSLGAGGELTCHFGLGADTTISAIEITWPNGQVTTPPPPGADTRVTYTQ